MLPSGLRLPSGATLSELLRASSSETRGFLSRVHETFDAPNSSPGLGEVGRRREGLLARCAGITHGAVLEQRGEVGALRDGGQVPAQRLEVERRAVLHPALEQRRLADGRRQRRRVLRGRRARWGHGRIRSVTHAQRHEMHLIQVSRGLGEASKHFMPSPERRPATRQGKGGRRAVGPSIGGPPQGLRSTPTQQPLLETPPAGGNAPRTPGAPRSRQATGARHTHTRRRSHTCTA